MTLSDVAKSAGVSVSAASKALLGGGGKTTRVSLASIRRIREAAQRLGYRPNLVAQRLASRRQDIIGLIVDSQCCNLYREIMSHIEQLTGEAGYRLQVGLVHDSLDSIRRYVDDFLGYNIQNVICMAHYYDFSREIPPLFSPFANPLFISKPMTEEKFPFVSPDYYGTCRRTTEHLLKNNRRKIVFLKTTYTTYDMEIRAQAFRDAHLALDIPFDEAQIYRGGVGECDTRELMEKMLADVLPMKPDALILGCSAAILWAMELLARRGVKIPEDITLVGMETWKGWESLSPSIAVMDNNPREIAEKAVQTIISNMNKTEKAPVQEIFVKGRLLVGG